MIIKKAIEVPVETVEDEDAKNVEIRWLLHGPDGAEKFHMRRFTVAPGGHTPYHQHDWEHEVYILEGHGAVRSTEGETAVGPGDCMLIPGGQEHQFRNSGAEPLTFLCMVPSHD
jgi:quercetin dioxygenase-like cupin family protein